MRKWYPLVAIAAAFVVAAVLYPRLPARVPVHWNARGEIDRFGSRLEGAFLIPAILLAVWGVMRVVPRIDPRRANYAKFAGTYDLVVNAIVTMGVLAHLLILGTYLGWPIPVGRVIPAGVGVLLVILGNVLPRARPTWFFGIRTPWTLSNERVWARTHRVGGYLMAAAGLVLLVSAAFPRPVTIHLAVGTAVVTSLATIVYSYIAWRQETSR